MADGGAFTSNTRARLVEKLQSLSERICIPENAEGRRVWAETDLLVFRPEDSCTLGITSSQRGILKKIASMAGLAGFLWPTHCFFLAVWMAFLGFSLLVGYRVILLVAGLSRRAAEARTPNVETSAIWPVYTVLVAIYREPKAVPDLVAALKGLDYPRRQLDIQILIEEEDDETLDALLAERLKPHFRIVPVPKGYVQTKPRALNYGLSLARGAYVAIYDAEDQMHAGQLKAAVRALQGAGGERLACVQAPLVPHNGAESWIAGQFELEYNVHFGLIVPGLAQLGLPVMLGGTSNHFKREVLEDVGAWDPYNVTEDADLGLRIARHGHKVGAIAPPTYEEAPISYHAWVKQRSRWVKGFIQTLGVFLRDPAARARDMGWVNWLSAVMLLGGSVISSVAHGPLAIWLLVCAFWPGVSPPVQGVVLLATGFGVHVVSCVMVWRGFSFTRLFAVLTAPLYWPLQSVAAAKAVWELFTNPYFWDKTEHGVTKKTLDRKKLRV